MPRCIKLALICLSFIPILAQAQKNPFYVPSKLPDRDSLKAIILKPKDSLQKLAALRELGHAYYESKRDSALYFFEQNIALARSINSRLWEADACNSIGFVSYVQGNYPRALQFLRQAITIAENPNSTKGEWKQNAPELISPDKARLSILARSYQHLASLYGYTGNFKENADLELSLFRKALAISSSLGDKTMMGIINMNISRHYSYGTQWDSILFYHERALQLMNETGYKRYVGNAMYNLGEAYRRAQQLNKAITCYWYGMEWGENTENTRSIADNALSLANVMRTQGNTDSAIIYAYIAADRYRSTLILNGLAESYAALSAAFSAQNKIDSAFHYQGLSLATRKELDAEDKARRFQQINFDEQMKAQEAAEKERRARNRIITFILLGGLAIFALIGIFLYRNNIARKKANDLLAEKNQELEIESALEKVRSRSLAMHKSDELQEVTNTVFEQMRALKIEAQTLTIFVTIEGSKDYNCWLQNDEQNYFNGIRFPYFKGNRVSEDHQMNSGDLETKTYTRDLKDDWFHFMFTQSEMRNIPESRKRYVLDSEYFTASVAEMKYTKIGMYRYSDKAFTNQEYKILKRFAQVFEQAYIRFLDLQKAEAQAREAQIEVAMEKVRSRTMAMHKSEELKEVIQVVYEQFIHLDMHVEHAGFIIDYKNRDDMHIWLADPNRVPSEVFIPYFDSPHWNSFLEAKTNGKDFFTNLLSFEEKNKFYQGLFNFFPIPDDAKDFYFNCPGLAISTVLLDNVGLYIENFSGKPYTDEENAVLMRFGKVFQQTYTRFLDLKKAEAQTREAQIEAALERTRTQSMLMQHSDEIKNISAIFHQQLLHLNIPSEFSYVWLPNEEKIDHQFWASWEEDEEGVKIYKSKQVTYPLDKSEPYTAACFAAWASPEQTHVEFIPPSDVPGFFNAWTELLDGAKNLRAEFFQEGIYYAEAYMRYGCFGINIRRELSGEEREVLKRFSIEFERAYTRFLDLKKAEAQAREAQIEAALERIRSRSMAMHKSEELADLSLEVVKQIQILGVPTWFCAFNIYDDDSGSSLEWGSNGQGVFSKYRTPREGVFLRYYEAGQRGETLLINEIGEEECPAHYEYLCSLPGVGEQLLNMKAAGIPFPTYQIDHVAFFKYGYIIFITYEQVPETHEIFKRFAKVFEQTYTRFLDLQKAEAQAREANIEAALERVRSRSLAMHHTDELQDVVNVAAQQLLKMDIDIDGGMFIAINEEVKDDLPFWAAAGAADYVQKVTLPFFDRPTYTGLRDAILRREPFYTEYYSKTEKDEFFKHMFRHHPWSQNSEEKKQELLAREGGYTRSLVVNRYTSIGITNHHGKAFSDEDNKVLKRFGSVLEQSYTRFLDLQKAEAQAREAWIEAALERVRSRTMSMQKSEELGDVASVLFKQMNQLVTNLWTCGFVLCEKDRNEDEWWLSMDGDFTRGFFLPNVGDYAHATLYEGWLKGDALRTVQLEGEALQQHYDWLMDIPVSRRIFEEMDAAGLARPDWQKLHAAYFSKGYLVLITREPSGEEEIFKRFASVFNLTYTRFNDLQIAEAHAAQAEQDLIAIKEAKQKAEQTLAELQATQKQLIQAEKMASLGELTAGIAHEIQNPLNFVNNFSEVNKELLAEIREEIEKGNLDEVKAIVNDMCVNEEKISEHGRRADAIVKGMLQHSRSSSGEKEATNINALADEYLRLAYHGFRAKDNSFNTTIKTDFDYRIGNINIIPQDIGRVLLNLINNAFYAVDEKKKQIGDGYEPEVIVTTKLGSNQKNELIISVRDNGNGIPEKIRNKIFQPFFTTKPTGQGTGLGLSLSYDIVKAHGGELRVETKEGEGTEFSIRLPIQS